MSPEKKRDFVTLYPVRWWQEAAGAGFCLLLLVLFRAKIINNLGDVYLGGIERDAGFYVWLVKSNIRDLFSLPWFDTAAFYPYSRTLAWSDNFILPSLAVLLLTKLGCGFTAAYNLVLLSAQFLNGYLTFRLAQRLSGAFAPALLSGGFFLSYAYLSGHTGHPQLQFAFFLPLALLFFFRWCAARSALNACCAGLSLVLCFLTTVYYAVFLALLLCTLIFLVCFLRPGFLKRKDFASLGSGLAAGLLPILPFLLPYLAVKSAFKSRELYEAYAFSASALSYFSSVTGSLLYRFTAPWTHDEATLFPGLILYFFTTVAFFRLCEAKQLRSPAIAFGLSFLFCLLASAASGRVPWMQYLTAFFLWAALLTFLRLIWIMGSLERSLKSHYLTNRALIACFLAAALLFFAISFGPIGAPHKGEFPAGVFTLFYYLFPGFDSIRAISRAGVLVVFCLSLTLPFVVPLVVKAPKWQYAFIAAAFLTMLAENFNAPYPLQAEKSTPSVFHYLQQVAGSDDGLLVLPMAPEVDSHGRVKSWGDYAEVNVNYMHWAFPLRSRLVNGYSGQRSRIILDFPRKFSGFPDQRSIDTLGSVSNLRYIVYASNVDSSFKKEEFLSAVARFPLELKYLMGDEDGYHLLEYTGISRLSERFTLKIPARPAGMLNLELQAGKVEGSPETEVSVLLPAHFGERPVARIVLAADGQWQNLTFEVPHTEEKIRPLELSFKVKDGKEVFLRSRKFQPYRN